MFDPQVIDKIDSGSNIENLEQTKLKNVQRCLAWMTYPISVVDGFIGPNTRNAFSEFKRDIGEDDFSIINASTKQVAVDNVESTQQILSRDNSSEKLTKNIIADLCKSMNIRLNTQIAYVLATVQWETNHTFRPVKEAYWKNENWRKNNLHYYPYYGRGYVQLTWRRNYGIYSSIVREKLVANPDLALDHKLAAFILVHGFKLGKFTGRKIEDYINSHNTDFLNARMCINGLDKNTEIAKLAEKYLNDLD